MLLSLPWLVLSLIAYNVIAFFSDDVQATLSEPLIGPIGLMSGGTWTLTLADLLIIFTLVILFVEILKSTRIGTISLLDHALSTILFVICLVEFIVVQKAATSTFFLIVVIALIDVVAGFSITLRAARRDVGFGAPH